MYNWKQANENCSRSPCSQLSQSLKENSYCSNTPNPTSAQVENPCHFQKLYVPRVQIDLMTSMQTGVQQSPEMFQVGPMQPNPVWSCSHLHNQWVTAKGVARAKGTSSATMQNDRRSTNTFFLEPGPHRYPHSFVWWMPWTVPMKLKQTFKYFWLCVSS